MALPRGLQRILAAHSHLLVDRGIVDSVRHIDVILLGSDAGKSPRGIPAVPSIEPAAAPFEEPVVWLPGKAVSAAPAAERAAAVEAIAYRSEDEGGGSYADPLLVQMLSDPDEALRARAIETLKDAADQVPFAALAQVAREDASAVLRIQALELLVERSERGEWREPVRVALNDPEPAVRARARELVLDWHLDLNE
jgi:HEAT repeat protein